MKPQKSSPLLNKKEISEVFSSSYLYEKKSFYTIEKSSQTYDTQRVTDNFIEEAKHIRSAFQDGQTIIVKNLEFYSKKIRQRCAELGTDVDVHMYLSPNSQSPSFPFHTDDRTVLLHILYGKRAFYLKNQKTISKHVLESGDELLIPLGLEHKAESMGPSCLLSFGIKNRLEYFVPGGLEEEDLT